MKLIKHFLLITILIITSSCFTNRLIENQDEEYQIIEKTHTIKLINVAQNGMMNDGGLGSYRYVKEDSSNKPGKFYKATIIIKNLTDTTTDVNLKKILLCSEDRKCLEPYDYHMKSIIDGYVNANLKLKGGKEKGRELYYAGPKSFNPKFLINTESGKFIDFDYEQ
ncbi:hypothetical protein [Rasiella sp. SM2506]|uniref:hypothetical protein n=1 Tax=Rasiella sp. SM2506 TaxID=3423914 RepID=UPI003D79B359